MGLNEPLVALAGCPVIERDDGFITFSPHPIIVTRDNPTLSHEICHKLAGWYNFAVFQTACNIRKDIIFKFTLNLMADWMDERKHSNRSAYLRYFVEQCKTETKPAPGSLPDSLQIVWEAYRNDLPTLPGVSNDPTMPELVAVADHLVNQMSKKDKAGMIIVMHNLGYPTKWGTPIKVHYKQGLPGGAGPMDMRTDGEISNYYVSAVARYSHLIDQLSTLWKRNKYDWLFQYYGEINWKNLVGTFASEYIQLPVFRIFSKIAMARNIYLVIDRSGSTQQIENQIMDTAIIITESLRQCKVPISVLDVGVEDAVINKIDEPLKLEWFTPMAEDGTPLGEVCSTITNASPEDYLLIITDGCPNNWDTLTAALNSFPGYHLTFVIGPVFTVYYSKTNGHAISVEPNTIIRELMNADTL